MSNHDQDHRALRNLIYEDTDPKGGLIERVLEDAVLAFKDLASDEYIDREDLRWYAWPQVWGDTSCGKGGPAGQSITSAQVIAVEALGMWAIYINGQHRYSIVHPSDTFYRLVKDNYLPGRRTAELEKSV